MRKSTFSATNLTRWVYGAPTHIVLWAYAVFAAAPLLLVLVNSFRTTPDIVQSPVGLPTSLYWGNYLKALTDGHLLLYTFNSVIITTVAVVIITIVTTLAAYPLARWGLPGGNLIILLFLSGIMLPLRFTVVPLFYQIEAMGLLDSRVGLILFYAASGIPLSTFVLIPFIRQLPIELEEAAAIDGAGPIAVFFRIVLPMLTPAVVVVVIFNFVPLWNEFFFPLILMRTPDKYPVSVGLTTFFGRYSVDLGPLFAGLVLVSLPLVILFLLATRRIIDGLSSGMFK